MIVDVHLTVFGSMGWQISCKCHCLQSSLQRLLDFECHADHILCEGKVFATQGALYIFGQTSDTDQLCWVQGTKRKYVSLLQQLTNFDISSVTYVMPQFITVATLLAGLIAAQVEIVTWKTENHKKNKKNN